MSVKKAVVVKSSGILQKLQDGDVLQEIPVTENVTLAESVSQYDLVTVTGYKADSNDATHFNRILGIVLEAGSISESKNVLTQGEVSNIGWSFSNGAIIYLNGTILSMSPPTTGFFQKVGVAKGANKISLDIDAPVKFN